MRISGKKAPAMLATFLLVALCLTLFPSNSATHQGAQEWISIYFDAPAATTAMPTADAAKTKSLCMASSGSVNVCKPGVANMVTFAATENNGVGPGYNITTDFVVTIWLSTTAPVPLPLHGVRILLTNGGLNLMNFDLQRPPRDGDGSVVTTLTSTPHRFSFASPRPAGAFATVPDAARLGLQIGVYAPGNSTAADVILHYGSSQFPAGISFGISESAGTSRLGNDEFRVSLAPDSLSFDVPHAEDDLAKKLTASPAGTGLTTSPSPVPVTWGSGVSPRSYTLLSDLVFTAKLQLAAEAPPFVGGYVALTANLYVGTQKINGTTQFESGMVRAISSASTTAPPAAFTVVLSIPASGLVIPAGTTLDLKVILQAPTDLNLKYGSLATPSGFVAAAQTGEGGALSSPTTSTTTSSGPTSSGGSPTSSQTGSSTGTSGTSHVSTSSSGPAAGSTLAQGSNANATLTDSNETAARVKDISDPPRALPGPASAILLMILASLVLATRKRAKSR